MSRCLYCYEPLSDEADFHAACSQKIFGTRIPPVLEFGKDDIEQLALKTLRANTSVTGVQPKLSLDIERRGPGQKRFTIVGLWGNYILKPPFERFPFMPEVEDLTMHLARIAGLRTAEHSLIRLASGELAYITKRFDRGKNKKLHVEDMAQLTGMLTERKYRSSMEKIGKAIFSYSTYSGNDALTFFELTVFCFLTGNADMHLKNFSLLRNEDDEILLAPAYDLLSTRLLLPEDKEELALTLNGKKSNFTKKDFDNFAEYLNINLAVTKNVYSRLINAIPAMIDFIEKSFLPKTMISTYRNLIAERAGRIM